MENIHSFIDSNKERYIQDFMQIVSQPSVGKIRQQACDCAHLLREKMNGMGIPAQVMETVSNPVVYADMKTSRPDQPTILFYGHYDVQPEGSLSLWDSHPYQPQICDGRMYGRGTADNKGQFLTHLLAIEAYLKETGDIPVNIKIILDGEEEIGSKGLADFAAKNKELFAADLVYTSDGGVQNNDIPNIVFGVRGVFNFDLDLVTAKGDNHSGNKGGVTRNPAWEMVQLLNKMIDRDGHVLMPGFYDTVVPMSAHDKELIDRLPYEPRRLAQNFGVKEITAKDKYDYYDKLMFQPTLTINGLVSGWTEPGCKNIIPCSATAKMEVRVAWKQDPFEIYNLIEKFVKENNPDVEMKPVEEFMFPSRTSADLPVFEPVIDAVEKVWGHKAVIFPVSGGSLPDAIWTTTLGLPSVLVPYGNPDEANHAPNENMDIEMFFKGIHTTAEVLHNLAK